MSVESGYDVTPNAEASAQSEEFFGWGAQDADENRAIHESDQKLLASQEAAEELPDQEDAETATDDQADDSEEIEPGEEEEEDLESDDAEEDQEVEVSATPRAQKRIQELTTQRKQAESERNQLLDVVKSLQQELAQQNAHRAQREAIRAQQEAQQQQAIQRQQYLEQLQSEGRLDLTDPNHIVALQAYEQMAQSQQQYAHLQQQIQQMKEQEAEQKYMGSLDDSLDVSLAGYDVPDGARQIIREQAVNYARIERISDPASAAARAIEAYKNAGFLKAKEPAKTASRKKPSKSLLNAQRGSAIRGQKAGRQKGEPASGDGRSSRSTNPWEPRW